MATMRDKRDFPTLTIEEIQKEIETRRALKATLVGNMWPHVLQEEIDELKILFYRATYGGNDGDA